MNEQNCTSLNRVESFDYYILLDFIVEATKDYVIARFPQV
jgi:hypothetical protein